MEKARILHGNTFTLTLPIWHLKAAVQSRSGHMFVKWICQWATSV